MRYIIYQLLVNRHAGISYRYHKFHDGTAGVQKVVSWCYLLWLNFAYYILFCRFLGKKTEAGVYEGRRLNIKQSESETYLAQNPFLRVEEYVKRLERYDVISFDIFDTLIFRPFALPEDVFFLAGEAFAVLDFKNIRTWAEWDARSKCKAGRGHTEVGLKDIWENVGRETGIPAKAGMEWEQETERKLCYANPFMLEVWKRLLTMDKKIILVSDMYLPEECIVRILENAGYTGMQKIYVSNEYHKSKADGSLYKEVVKDWFQGEARSLIHIGDNLHSDRDMAKRNGLDVFPYPHINKNLLLYRPTDMSCIIGSAYRAVVNGHLYNGLHSYGMEYEYGFIYGGLFAVGYCSFIHEHYKGHGLDKLLFLSRDGDILKQVYDFLYPQDATEYVYWSRKAAVKLMADGDKRDYFRRFLFHKVNQDYTIRQILHSMDLDCLTGQLAGFRETGAGSGKEEGEAEKEKPSLKAAPEKGKYGKKRNLLSGLKPGDELTDKNVTLLKHFLEANWEQVRPVYASQSTAAAKYYAKALEGCRKAAAVDIGWAGSGWAALSHLTEKVWKLPCQIEGIIAGTNTVHNAQPDASEIFLQTGKLTAYLYSQSHNRDLLKKHDPNKDYNVFWELLLSSTTPQFAGFYEGKRDGETVKYLKEENITLSFGKTDENQKGIREIQRGILDFAHEYQRHFGDFPYMFRISGRDAYAPMLVAASHNERYLKAMEKRFCLEKNLI